MKHYLGAQNEVNKLIINNTIKAGELDRLSEAESRWAKSRHSSMRKRQIKKGDVYQVEFGKNFIPEMSYEHRGLVIGVKGKLLYVLPIFSYQPSKHADVFHPVDNPDSKSDLYLLKCGEYNFIHHDSVLKLNDLRTISVQRILYQQKNGYMDINSDEYKTIENLVLHKYFPEYAYELNLLREENIRLQTELEELKSKQYSEL